MSRFLSLYRLFSLLLVMLLGVGFLSAPFASPLLTPLQGQKEPSKTLPAQGQADTGRRVALVLGNTSYSTRLDNTDHDAEDMAKALEEAGFKVIKQIDTDRDAMVKLFQAFRKLLDGATVGLLYYSGHGAQAAGKNYLVPIHATVSSEADLEVNCVSLSYALKQMSESKCPLRLVILDACRTNPFHTEDDKDKGFGEKGLARESAPSGTLIAYATSPGKIATTKSKRGRNSLYTECLLEYLTKPGIEIKDMFVDVRKAVLEASMEKQLTWEDVSLLSRFYMMPKEGGDGGNFERLETSSKLIVATTPSGAELYLDGKATGKLTPCELMLDLASTTQRFGMELRLSGYAPLRGTLTLQQGKVTRVTETLQKSAPDSKPVPANSTLEKIERKTGLKLVKIPGGSFDMGSEKGEGYEKPVHRVRLDSYWMSENVVTVAQFRRFTEAKGYKYDWKEWKPDWDWLDNHPMVNVTWLDAVEYCKWAGVSLPTEAEWEYASRGGLQGEEYPWQGGWDAKPGNLHGKGKSTSPVGTFFKNGYGLYDMSGNVWQWCGDWYAEDYYKTSPEANPKGPSKGAYRVLRGGPWTLSDPVFHPELYRCARRNRDYPNSGSVRCGFRVVFRGLP